MIQHSKLIILFCVISFCLNKSYSQTPSQHHEETNPFGSEASRVTAADEADIALNLFFKTVQHAAECGSEFDFSNYQFRYDPAATIQVSNKKGNITTWAAKDYFYAIKRLCSTLYNSMSFSFEHITIKPSDLSWVSTNVYWVNAPFRQTFIGIRSNGKPYKDVTLKRIMIKIYIDKNQAVTTKILKVEASLPEEK